MYFIILTLIFKNNYSFKLYGKGQTHLSIERRYRDKIAQAITGI
jgi:hypothetical protein